MRARGIRRRSSRLAASVAALLLIIAALPASALAAADPSAGRFADLDGQPLALNLVGQYYCQDFQHPAIHCFRTSADLEASVSTLATSSVDYVVIYDFTLYQGPYMYLSDDYTVLAVIGWNDRISSFRAINSMSGKFWTDWFYGGTGYSFCCDQNFGSLGSFDNSFSSVFHY